jgi:hypothetical protein
MKQDNRLVEAVKLLRAEWPHLGGRSREKPRPEPEEKRR